MKLDKQWMTVTEAAEFVGKSKALIAKMVREGGLVSDKLLGRSLDIPKPSKEFIIALVTPTRREGTTN